MKRKERKQKKEMKNRETRIAQRSRVRVSLREKKVDWRRNNKKKEKMR